MMVNLKSAVVSKGQLWLHAKRVCCVAEKYPVLRHCLELIREPAGAFLLRTIDRISFPKNMASAKIVKKGRWCREFCALSAPTSSFRLIRIVANTLKVLEKLCHKVPMRWEVIYIVEGLGGGVGGPAINVDYLGGCARL